MKGLVKRSFITNIARREVFSSGRWLKSVVDKKTCAIKCVGCLVGQTFLALSKEENIVDPLLSKTFNAITKVIRGEKNNPYGIERYVESEVNYMIQQKCFNGALSACFEGSCRESGGKMKKTRALTIERILKHFPEEFELEVDGLELKDKLPRGVKRIAKLTTHADVTPNS